MNITLSNMIMPSHIHSCDEVGRNIQKVNVRVINTDNTLGYSNVLLLLQDLFLIVPNFVKFGCWTKINKKYVILRVYDNIFGLCSHNFAFQILFSPWNVKIQH